MKLLCLLFDHRWELRHPPQVTRISPTGQRVVLRPTSRARYVCRRGCDTTFDVGITPEDFEPPPEPVHEGHNDCLEIGWCPDDPRDPYR